MTNTGRAGQRANVEAARDVAAKNPVNLIFFSATKSSGRPAGKRALTAQYTLTVRFVCYKETSINGSYGGKIDPADPPYLDGLMAGREFQPARRWRARPENALTGNDVSGECACNNKRDYRASG